jgi:hypothetical protein
MSEDSGSTKGFGKALQRARQRGTKGSSSSTRNSIATNSTGEHDIDRDRSPHGTRTSVDQVVPDHFLDRLKNNSADGERQNDSDDSARGIAKLGPKNLMKKMKRKKRDSVSRDDDPNSGPEATMRQSEGNYNVENMDVQSGVERGRSPVPRYGSGKGDKMKSPTASLDTEASESRSSLITYDEDYSDS